MLIHTHTMVHLILSMLRVLFSCTPLLRDTQLGIPTLVQTTASTSLQEGRCAARMIPPTRMSTPMRIHLLQV